SGLAGCADLEGPRGPGEGDANPATSACRRVSPKGSRQDALPDGRPHLSGALRGHPRSRGSTLHRALQPSPLGAPLPRPHDVPVLGRPWAAYRCTGIPCIFFFQAEDGIRVGHVTGVQTCALPIFGLDLHVAEASAAAWAP